MIHSVRIDATWGQTLLALVALAGIVAYLFFIYANSIGEMDPRYHVGEAVEVKHIGSKGVVHRTWCNMWRCEYYVRFEQRPSEPSWVDGDELL